MVTNSLAFKIGGEAGWGIRSSGEMWLRLMRAVGLYAYGYMEYPSLIRGGHNSYHVWAEELALHSTTNRVDLLVALNHETIELHSHELSPHGAIVYDGEKMILTNEDIRRDDLLLVNVPMLRLAKDSAGSEVMRNMVALGASCAVVGLELEALVKLIDRMFGKKGEQIVQSNTESAKAGYEYVKQHLETIFYSRIEQKSARNDEIVINGNDAIAIGAIAGGCKYYAAYPMTPASSILEFLAKHGPSYGLVARHVEDEIAALNGVIGASLMGVRAMCGTAGGGFSLMVEALGLAGMLETPAVIVEAQRPGPATGLPTWGNQADLRFVLHSAQDEFPRVIVAPGDPLECFTETIRAFELADSYQLPVIVLTDKFLAEDQVVTEQFPTEALPSSYTDEKMGIISEAELSAKPERFKRYELTANGVSSRSIPGQKGGVYLANSDEHDEYGYTTEDATARTAMHEKRLRKLQAVAQAIPAPKVYGPILSDILIVCWGSTKGPVMDAITMLAKHHIKASMLHLLYVWPFPTEVVEKTLKVARNVIIVEANATAQCAGLIREMTGIEIKRKLLKSDGRPWTPEEIAEKILLFLKSQSS